MEAPGTAPGSATLIPHSVYRHSRRTGTPNMRRVAVFRNGADIIIDQEVFVTDTVTRPRLDIGPFDAQQDL